MRRTLAAEAAENAEKRRKKLTTKSTKRKKQVGTEGWRRLGVQEAA